MQPPGYTDVTEGDTTPDPSDTTGPNDSPMDNILPVTVDSGETDDGNDFVEEQPGSISGTVSEDTDQGPPSADQPIAGVTITLLDGLGNVVATTTTDSNGDYEFTNIPPGIYIVVETQPAGFNDVTEGDMSPDDNEPSNEFPTDNQIIVSLDPGESDEDNDFIEEVTPLGSISGTVSEDTNMDGLPDQPIPGVTITLEDGAGNVIATTVTDGNGDYIFTNLPPGTYIVIESQPPGFSDVAEGDQTPEDPIDNPNEMPIDNQIIVSLDLGENDADNDFIEEIPCVDINGTVFVDEDQDGCLDGGDTAIEGATVTLFACDPATGTPGAPGSGTPVDEQTTDESGQYAFECLDPSLDYYIEIGGAPSNLAPCTDTCSNGDTVPVLSLIHI